MQIGRGSFHRQKRGIGYAANVTLAVDSSALTPYRRIDCHGEGFRSQGYIERATETGYEDWKWGALEGASYGLRVVGHPEYGVAVTEIEGLTTDTNPTVVAFASALAVWNALSFEPRPEEMERLEAQVYTSWDAPAGSSQALSFGEE